MKFHGLIPTALAAVLVWQVHAADPVVANQAPDAAAKGVSYRIEGSTDLTEWTTVETDIIGMGGVITRFYSTENIPKRYFRARRN